ncbi:MAG TPA: acetylornithine deacetylase [Candidatus Thioglobus sp.]|jgi:acetylornithine deacetylase|nr:acetylornithine deacetylase [Candidatus Thioglobus sp.]HIL42222.1 acetylornithine deacetylase [Gammaproteobacteria bacterium]
MTTTKEATELLQDLVSFDTTSYKSNLELIEYIKSYLTNCGIGSTLVHDDSGKKANLYATIGRDDVGGIMLSGHTDVVPVSSQRWDTDPFCLTELGGNLYGRGSADMKGFIALALSRVPKILSLELDTPFHLAFSYDEEVGCIGVQRLLDLLENRAIKPRCCIVGEPTSMEVVVGHKGKCSRRVHVHGHACHSGQAPFGVNAVDYAAELIVFIRKLAKEKANNGPFDYEYEVPYTSLHTGTVSGGTALNIVPNYCEFDYEIRHLYEEDPQKLLDKIESYARDYLQVDMRSHYKDTGFDFKDIATYPGLSIDPNSTFVNQVKQLLSNKTHRKVIFGTEGGLFNQRLGIPTLVCGPGSIDQAHKANEYISLEQLQMGGHFLDKLIESQIEG